MEAVLTTTLVQPEVKRLNLFERYLTIWVGLCMVAGVALGRWAPDFVHRPSGVGNSGREVILICRLPFLFGS